MSVISGHVLIFDISWCINNDFLLLCGSRKYPYSPHRRDWKFRGGGGFLKSQKFQAMYEAKLEFPEGWGGHMANPFRRGDMDIFWNHTLFRQLFMLPLVNLNSYLCNVLLK